MRISAFVVMVLLMLCIPVLAAPSFLGGYSGNIITPDAVILPQGTWEISYHDFMEVLGDNDLKAAGIIYGVTPNLEVGVSFIDNSESDTAINGKYRLLAETATRPTIVVGVFDVASSVNFLDPDPGLFVLASKNITSVASDIVDSPSRPLRLTLGLGTGVFNGLFAGLDWTLESRLSLMAEFFGGELGGDENFFNAGIRYAATDDIRLDAATIDFEDFAFGASYRFAF
ncbi:MAG: hypothetical protein ACYC27_01620 [Armatimonadota bacterium]